jgi:hypothetical protein
MINVKNVQSVKEALGQLANIAGYFSCPVSLLHFTVSSHHKKQNNAHADGPVPGLLNQVMEVRFLSWVPSFGVYGNQQ